LREEPTSADERLREEPRTVIVDLPDTSTGTINKKIVALREEGGAITLGRVLTLVIAPDTEAMLEESIDAANAASREHPCRVIVVIPGDRLANEARLDAQLRVGRDAGANEVVVLRLSGPLANHASSVVTPFLLPDTPVVTWWPDVAPDVPARDPLGQLAIRRITDATNGTDPLASIKGRLAGYTAGDTDLAWSRITYWRALLTSALDQAPFGPIESVLVSGLKDEPALDILAGWLASRIDVPVTRAVGELKVELVRADETITLSRPQEGVTATLTRTGKPDARVPLARRETRDCLAEDMRRLDADEIYYAALQGIDKVKYV
jgi:glucose-6-phosphate dehydrogenase assembly protein OpcA